MFLFVHSEVCFFVYCSLYRCFLVLKKTFSLSSFREGVHKGCCSRARRFINSMSFSYRKLFWQLEYEIAYICVFDLLITFVFPETPTHKHALT